MAKATATAGQGKVLVYCRVSTTGQEEHGTSLDSQERECVAHATALGYTIGRITREVYSGAELWDRPKLSQDRMDFKAGHFAALICYATDRLSRDPIHLAILAEECERAGVALHFVSETFDDSDEAALIRYVKGYSSKKEREKIRERSLRGKHQRVLMGKIHGHGSELYGYRRDKERGVRLLYEPEPAIVRQIFAWIAHDRLPVRTVARYLNEQGVPPPSAGKLEFDDPTRAPRWVKTQLYRMLEHPAYKGETVAWRWKGAAKPGGAAHHRPTEEWLRLPDGVTPAIVSPELWAEAHEALRAHRGETTRNAARPFLLRGHIWCTVCGKRMQPMMENGATTHPRGIYRCSSRDTSSGACGGKRAPAEAVEAWAWEWIAAVLRNPDLIADELRRREDAGPDPILASDLDKAEREIARCEREQAKLLRGFASCDDSKEDALWRLTEREVKRLEAERERWQDVADKAEARLAEQNLASAQLTALHEACTRWAHNLDAFDFDDKREALAALDVRMHANGTDPNDWHIAGAVPIGPVEDATAGLVSFGTTSAARCARRLPRPPAPA